MFEYSFVPSGNTGRPLSVAVAGLGQAMLVGGLVLAQLYFVESLPERGLLNALMLAPVPTAPLALPPPMVAERIPRAAPVQRKFNPDALVSPVVVPKAVAIINEAPPLLEMDAAAGGVPGGIPGEVNRVISSSFTVRQFSVFKAGQVCDPPWLDAFGNRKLTISRRLNDMLKKEIIGVR